MAGTMESGVRWMECHFWPSSESSFSKHRKLIFRDLSHVHMDTKKKMNSLQALREGTPDEWETQQRRWERQQYSRRPITKDYQMNWINQSNARNGKKIIATKIVDWLWKHNPSGAKKLNKECTLTLTQWDVASRGRRVLKYLKQKQIVNNYQINSIKRLIY